MSTANLSRMLERNRYRFGDRDALVDGAIRLTHAQLDDAVHLAAAGLAGIGVGRGSIVGILAPNRAEYVIALLALSRVGAIAVPLHVRLRPEELGYILDHAGVTTLLADELYHEAVTDVLRLVPAVTTVVTFAAAGEPGWLLWRDVMPASADPVPDAAAGLDDVQRILYTSGTTGRPKGVTITHGNVIWNHLAQITELEMTSAERVLLSTPLYHVSATDAPGFTALYVGGALVCSPSFDAETILAIVASERITGLLLPLTTVHAMLDLPGVHDTSSVRWMVFGGLPVDVLERLHADLFPGARMVEALGMTEYTSGIAYMDRAHMLSKPGSSGRPVVHADVRVVDRDGADVPMGESGEIVVRGPKITPGYWRDPDATKAAFRDGWFHTGDAGRFDEDGYIYFVDRFKDVIRSGDENIASVDIERVIETHPAVAEVAVIGIPDPRWGETPKAFVVPATGSELTVDDVIAWCRDGLASFKVPRHVELVDSLPRNHSGKVLKRQLREAAGG